MTAPRPRDVDVLSPFQGACVRMLQVQRADGAIPWFEHGPWDPWNHAECVMALGVMGEHQAAVRALDHLAGTQDADGAWFGEYGNALPMDGRLKLARQPAPAFRDSNFCAYPAVALWHLHRLGAERSLVERYWPMVRRAIGFVLGLQHAAGDISWSLEALGGDGDDAVLAGCASIFKSLACALSVADLVGDPQPGWRAARARLGQAILQRPDRFDRAGADRSGFAMDWYYPVLTGALPPVRAAERLRVGAAMFIEPGRGCRCVAAEPWATVAESCELALALIRLGDTRRAARLLDWQAGCRDGEGAYWMGWQFEEDIAWPQEQPSWTQAAVILAADALHRVSGASAVLTRD